MNAGADLHTLMREVTLPTRLRVGEGYGKVSWGVRAIWELYAGWFLAQSTTELYDVPASEAWADIVSAAGAEPLVAAAQAALKADRPERALHLTDIVLAAEPAHRGAAATALAAHERLLARSGGENFWETRWLELRIAEHERALALHETGRASDETGRTR